MPLSDEVIFQTVFMAYKDEPIETIMERYSLARRINAQIEGMPQKEEGNAVEIMKKVMERKESEEQGLERSSVKAVMDAKRALRRLRINPADAIGEHEITCCVCGRKTKSITNRHLAKHGLTVDDYKNLCGYVSDQHLMCLDLYERSKSSMSHARKSRQKGDNSQLPRPEERGLKSLERS